MSENSTQKIITDIIFKSAIEKILTEISDYIYVEEPYTDLEIDDMFDATSQEIDYYSSLINDGMISENRLWSAKKISEELAKCIIESNAYTDGLLSNLSSIELKYVTSLPVDNISSNTIYILKSSVESEPDTLNLYDGTQWTEIGKFEFDMSGYVTTDDMNTELGKKANDNEVVKVSDILTDTTGASNNNVLSASVTVTELDKKIDKTSIVNTLSSNSTDDKVLSTKAIYDKVLTKSSNLGVITEDAFIISENTDLNNIVTEGTYRCKAGSICNTLINCPIAGQAFKLIVNVGNSDFLAQYLVVSNTENFYPYVRTKHSLGNWGKWKKLCATSVADVPYTTISYDTTVMNSGIIAYEVINGICYVYINYVLPAKVGNALIINQTAMPKPTSGLVTCSINNDATNERIGLFYIESASDNYPRAHLYTTGKTGYATFSYPVAEE